MSKKIITKEEFAELSKVMDERQITQQYDVEGQIQPDTSEEIVSYTQIFLEIISDYFNSTTKILIPLLLVGMLAAGFYTFNKYTEQMNWYEGQIGELEGKLVQVETKSKNLESDLNSKNDKIKSLEKSISDLESKLSYKESIINQRERENKNLADPNKTYNSDLISDRVANIIGGVINPSFPQFEQYSPTN